MADDCLFCKIHRGEIPSTEVYSDEMFYAFRDVNPVAPTHILVIPRKHIATIADAEPDDAELIGKLVLRANAIAREENLVESGYRYVMNCGAGAGQTVFHIHLHLLGGRGMKWPPG